MRMDPDRISSLTARERDCLRLVDRESSSGEIAARLDLSPSSVDTYIKRAREKLGAPSRFVAARALRDYEARTQSGGPPDRGLAASERSNDSSDRQGTAEAGPDHVVVMEERAAFTPFPSVELASSRDEAKSIDVRSSLRRTWLVVMLIVAFSAVVLLAFPLTESFQRLADVLEPHR